MQKDKSLQPDTTTATPKKITADKSLQPEKKSNDIQVGDTVSYPHKDADGGRRTSLVYEVTDDTVTIVNDEGVYKTVGIVQVERV
nr:MAG TPA: hypothetical protein [Caudoviricetes sp.]